MTGGQMAPTTLPGQVTQTSPTGRDVSKAGLPIRVCELLAAIDGTGYVERVAVNSVANVKKAKAAIKKAFANQVAGKVAETINPEEQVKKLIDKCTTPTTDGICECVANSIVANLTPEQWKIVNHHLFDARRNVSTSEFLLKNPWIIPKLAAPYAKCSDKK
jgi:hypothetical protein